MLERDVMRRIARLSALGIKDEEIETYSQELGSILQWVEQLNELNVENISPMVGTEEARLRLREDAVTDGDCLEEVLSNAPKRIGDFYAVPKVVE